MAENFNEEEVQARFEELSVLEAEFEDVELKLIRESNALNAPLWKKRAEVIAKIPHFWTLVFEQAPPELDTFILPSDAQIFAECFESLEVSRFEIDDPKGSPRSISIKFGFADNEYFEDKVLEKKFWFRKSRDWEGLVSEPVKISWKKGKDTTFGLTDAAVKLAEARKKAASGAKQTELPGYQKLVSMIEESTESSPSFFAWFAFVSDYRWVSAEESEQAEKEDAERLEKLKRGEKVEDPEDDDDDTFDYQETEVFPQGGEIATLIAEDLWPSAIKYYKQSHEQDGEDFSDIDVEDMDEDEDESGDEIDIRGLVGKGRAGSPPNKKQRKA